MRINHLICVVDDDDAVRDSIQVMLQACGYSVLAFSSAAEALSEDGLSGADCLLLDLNMPDMDGMSLVEALRSGGVRAPAIILTANSERMNARMKNANVIKVLHKPVAEDEILHWIENACGNLR